jgi:hypothetical protein
MFSYYGSKSKIVNYYPRPQHRRIVEPFAGSARYALKYWDREIILIDAYPVITGIWRWLQTCSPADIKGLPSQPLPLANYPSLSEVEKWFLGYCWNPGNQYPGHGVGQYIKSDYWMSRKITMANDLHKIRHWIIRDGDYTTAPVNQAATWFVDPPYQYGGHKYAVSSIHLDFGQLATFCRSLTGQKIVCENAQANWLPFTPLKTIQGASNKPSTECIWTGESRAVQTDMFSTVSEKALQT